LTIRLPVEWSLAFRPTSRKVVSSSGYYVSSSPGWSNCWLLPGVWRAACLLCLSSRHARRSHAGGRRAVLL